MDHTHLPQFDPDVKMLKFSKKKSLPRSRTRSQNSLRTALTTRPNPRSLGEREIDREGFVNVGGSDDHYLPKRYLERVREKRFVCTHTAILQ